MTPEIKALIESLGEPADGNEYTIKPIDGKWWIEHNNVCSSEPLEQWVTANSNPLRKMFFEQFNNCVEYRNEDAFPGETHWIDKETKKWVFNYNTFHPDILLFHNDFWQRFSFEFSLNYNEARDLLKPLVDEAFKKEGLTPVFGALGLTPMPSGAHFTDMGR
jgi:hypothetical protein